MINIYDIIQVLAPEYKISKKSSIKQHLVIKDIEKCKFTNFEPHGTFTNLFSCLLFQHESTININNLGQYQIIYEDIYNAELVKLKEFIEKYEFNPLINTKKMLNLITQNIVNNELILFLSGYFNSNIYMYSFESKLLKIYYLEEHIDPTKKSYVIVNKKDLLTPNIGFQTLDPEGTFGEKTNLNHLSPIIVDLCKDIYTIAIGLKENKSLEIGAIQSSVTNPSNFIIGLNEQIQQVQIDDSIFVDNLVELEDDDEMNNFNILDHPKINLEEINLKFSKENLMKYICKYYEK
jgi:hypothetical protein